VEIPVWYGLLAPAATSREIVATLAGASVKAARSADLRQRLQEQGADPVGSTPEEFGRILREEIARYAEIVKAANLKTE
jgi:tripartite-type tricarboxylate transporter receptor subunit TctC